MTETKPKKPGWKSTEFWGSQVLFPALMALIGSGVLDPGHWVIQVAALIVGALTALGYTNSRGKTKAAAEIAAGNVAAAALMRAVDPPEA